MNFPCAHAGSTLCFYHEWVTNYLWVYTVSDERYRSLLEISNHIFSVFFNRLRSVIDLSFNTFAPVFIYFFLCKHGKLSRDLQHGTSFEVFTVGFSALSAIFDCCPPEPRFHDFARVFVTNAGKVYYINKQKSGNSNRNNMPYNSREMRKYAWQFGINIITTSPTYSQANGLAEKAVHIVKNSLRKECNLNEGLMEYRNTPISNFPNSPDQMFFSRQIRTRVPVHPSVLVPQICHGIPELLEKTTN